ncbi:MAG: SRPBCC family protein [Tateyamaria sp.]
MTLANIALYTVAGIAILGVATLALPRHVTVERSATIAADPSAVLALAASSAGYQTFNPYLSQDPALKIDPFGPDTGVGSGFRFDGKDGKGTQTVAELTGERVVYAIDLGALGTPTQSIEATATDAGTQVTWRMENDLGFNPVFRVFGLFADGMMGPVFERGLANLDRVTA